MAIDRGITLNRQTQSRHFIQNRGEGFRLRVVTSDAVNMPAEVFLFERALINPYTGVTGERFVSVCSVFDLTIYPAAEPDTTQWPQFYRKSTIDVILASQSMSEDAWTEIYQEVCVLVASLNKLDYLGEAEAIRCGTPLEEEESEAPSESGSESEAASESASEPVSESV